MGPCMKPFSPGLWLTPPLRKHYTGQIF